MINAERVVLRPLASDCFDAYERFYCDSAASANYGGPLTAGQAFSRLASDIGSWVLQGFGVWAVEQRTTQDVVGVCGFWQGIDWPRELTWWLLPSARGAGLAIDASRAAVTFAYDVCGWESVETYMHDDNEAARRLAERLGGVAIGRPVFPDGVTRSLYRIPRP